MPTEVRDEDSDVLSATKSLEFGTTTGRQRRMGWFDSLLVKKAITLNGATSMAIVRLDILDDLDSIKICTAYDIDGKIHTNLPANSTLLERAQPIYEEVTGWKKSTSDITTYQNLPKNAQLYVERLSELCGIPVSIISVGTERTQTIIVNNIVNNNK